MQRYFVDQIIDGKVIFSKDQTHHILKVMRMREKEQITCAFQKKIYLCQIISVNPLEVIVEKELEENNELEIDVTLLYCLPKGDKLDLVIQKATELGVKEIILVQSERCIAKIKKEDEQKKLIRFNTIAKEASEQSKRSMVPTIDKIINFKDIANFKFDYQFIAYENDRQNTFFTSLSEIKKHQSIAILVGSEGGFSEKEVEYALKNSYQSVSLGKRILRSETAVFYALSVIGFMIER